MFYGGTLIPNLFSFFIVFKNYWNPQILTNVTSKREFVCMANVLIWKAVSSVFAEVDTRWIVREMLASMSTNACVILIFATMALARIWMELSSAIAIADLNWAIITTALVSWWCRVNKHRGWNRLVLICLHQVNLSFQSFAPILAVFHFSKKCAIKNDVQRRKMKELTGKVEVGIRLFLMLEDKKKSSHCARDRLIEFYWKSVVQINSTSFNLKAESRIYFKISYH